MTHIRCFWARVKKPKGRNACAIFHRASLHPRLFETGWLWLHFGSDFPQQVTHYRLYISIMPCLVVLLVDSMVKTGGPEEGFKRGSVYISHTLYQCAFNHWHWWLPIVRHSVSQSLSQPRFELAQKIWIPSEQCARQVRWKKEKSMKNDEPWNWSTVCTDS